MSQLVDIKFSNALLPKKGVIVILCDKEIKWDPSFYNWPILPAVKKAIKSSGYKADFTETLNILTPEGSELDSVILLGLGDRDNLVDYSWLTLGGKIMDNLSKLSTKAKGCITICLDLDLSSGERANASQATDFALGLLLSSYRFDKYKTKDKKIETAVRVTIKTKVVRTAKKIWEEKLGLGEGVILARNLVNEPANVLIPKELVNRSSELTKMGCKVDLLYEKDMRELKMESLLGVAQGSRNSPCVAILRWNGGKPKEKPIAFIGKGVTFDTGGISIKPAASMENMKGDMAGAAAVVGLMYALASRKAKTNIVGIISAVENMPDGNAQRPGDIVTSMSGQTIEIVNTDAEGRLILADILWYCQSEFKPRSMINLATLTGAILVSLGRHHAGLFSNSDELSEQLVKSGLKTEERIWRMPLGVEYDKMINSENADMKNIGDRFAGSITAAQFLQRFVNKTPWAHLDISGVAIESTQNAINYSWGSGYGVRLLDRFVADYCER
ncbi:leucyl aminopeptidase [Candidatus Endowatersipora endosymbiont of Watersipora subatra]|uniref:leucyl aminopeptidase n=1 Tax=Candidatus Endowatersipora endosymbiont of Watersipora subatra TaxID=3077946 RepID=UPI00312CAF07